MTPTTPLMKQYEDMKKKHPDAILLFRVGDTYECYEQDAKDAISILDTEYKVYNTDDSGDVVYTNFPHTALDTYLPALVRAGKRVAICKELADPDERRVIETVTPADENNQPKQEPIKPEKKMDTKSAIKQINCDLTDEQLRELGEPVAYFTVDFPKAVKCMANYTYKDPTRPSMQSVCIEPERGKMIASDCHILYTADIKCDGIWPQGEPNKPFQCFIDPKAVREFAGKQVDIAVWDNLNGTQKVTACEAVGVLTQHRIGKSMMFPDWQRVMPKEETARIVIAESAIKDLRKFVKDNMGKTKKEREERCAVIHVTPEADDIMVRIVNKWSGDEVAKTQADLREVPDFYIQQMYNAQLFYYSIQEGFNGEITLKDDCYAAKFKGEQRTSILMPVQNDEIGHYMTTEKPESK